MTNKKDYNPQVVAVLSKEKYRLTLLFDNNEIRIINFKELEKEFDLKYIFEKIYNTWDKLKLENVTISFSFDGGYQIDNFTIYEKSMA
jgi:hypothetical protein